MHKHFLIALLVGAGTLLAASCSEESATVRQRTLEVVSSDTNFPVDGGSRTVTTARAATAACRRRAAACQSRSRPAAASPTRRPRFAS